MDSDPLSHERLDKDQTTTWEDSGGRFTVGTALEIDGLMEAGIEEADVFVAATSASGTLHPAATKFFNSRMYGPGM